jgi:hypothetical protein
MGSGRCQVDLASDRHSESPAENRRSASKERLDLRIRVHSLMQNIVGRTIKSPLRLRDWQGDT